MVRKLEKKVIAGLNHCTSGKNKIFALEYDDITTNRTILFSHKNLLQFCVIAYHNYNDNLYSYFYSYLQLIAL